MAFDKFATGGVLEYKDIKKFFESVGHVPSQKEIDDAIELVTKSKSRDHSLKCLIVDDVYYSTKNWGVKAEEDMKSLSNDDGDDKREHNPLFYFMFLLS